MCVCTWVCIHLCVWPLVDVRVCVCVHRGGHACGGQRQLIGTGTYHHVERVKLTQAVRFDRKRLNPLSLLASANRVLWHSKFSNFTDPAANLHPTHPPRPHPSTHPCSADRNACFLFTKGYEICQLGLSRCFADSSCSVR